LDVNLSGAALSADLGSSSKHLSVIQDILCLLRTEVGKGSVTTVIGQGLVGPKTTVNAGDTHTVN